MCLLAEYIGKYAALSSSGGGRDPGLLQTAERGSCGQENGDPFGASYLKGSVRKGNPHFKIKTGNAGLGKGDRDGICNRRIYAV